MRKPRTLSLLLPWLVALSAAGAEPPAAKDPVRVAYVFSDGNLPGTVEAYAALLKEHPELAGKIKLSALTESSYNSTPKEDLLAAKQKFLELGE